MRFGVSGVALRTHAACTPLKSEGSRSFAVKIVKARASGTENPVRGRGLVPYLGMRGIHGSAGDGDAAASKSGIDRRNFCFRLLPFRRSIFCIECDTFARTRRPKPPIRRAFPVRRFRLR